MPTDKPTEKKVDPDRVVAKEQQQGYRGLKVDPLPNSAYSLESGPTSPSNHGCPQIDIEQLQQNQKKGA